MRQEKVAHITPSTTCLMVIDPQDRLMKAVHKAEKIEKRCAALIRCARQLKMAVIATTQYAKGIGPLVPSVASLIRENEVVDKMEFDAFKNAKVVQLVKDLAPAVDTVLLVGVEAHICIYQTALGAMTMGLKPWIVTDAVSSRDRKNVKDALSRFNMLGIDNGPMEMAVYELLGKAGTADFKALLPLFK